MLRCWPILLAFTIACGGDDKDGDTDEGVPVEPIPTTDTDTDDPTDPPTACDATITSVDPGNNAYAQADTTVTATFSEAIAATDPYDIMVHDAASGAAVAGTLSLAADGLSATFTPDAPLAYEAEYDVDVLVCDHEIAGGFTTLPEPVDPAVLPGRTYGIEYKDVVWVKPGNTQLLTLDVDYILVQVDEVDAFAGTLEAVAGTGELDPNGVVVPDCPAVVQAPTSDFSLNPVFTVGPTDLQYPYGDGSITIEQFTLQGQFSADASQIVDVHIEGLFDPQQIMPGVSCALAAAAVSGTCVPCPSGAGDCLELEATAAQADWLPTLDVISECGL